MELIHCGGAFDVVLCHVSGICGVRGGDPVTVTPYLGFKSYKGPQMAQGCIWPWLTMCRSEYPPPTPTLLHPAQVTGGCMSSQH